MSAARMQIFFAELDGQQACSVAATEYREADSAGRSNQLRPSAGGLYHGSFTAAAQLNSQEDDRHHRGF
jgi:hypothetical protein